MPNYKRLTTDNPADNFGTMLNMVFSKDDGWVYICGEDEMPIQDFVISLCKKISCNMACEDNESLVDKDQHLCDCCFEPCPLADVYAALSGFSHLRDRLKQYEDTGLSPERAAEMEAKLAEVTRERDAEPACPSRLDCMGGEGGKVPTDDAMRYAFEKTRSVACPSLDDSARITCQTLIAIALGRGLAKDAQLLECARYIAWQIVSEFTDDTTAQDKINDAKTACDVAKAAIRILKASEDERDISIAELAKADAEGRVRILPEAASGTCGSCAYFRRAKGTRAGTCELRPYRVSKWSPAKYPFRPSQSQKGCKRYQEAARGEHNVDDTDQ